MRLSIIISIALAIMTIGCSGPPKPAKTMTANAATPSPTPTASPSPTPLLSDSEKAWLKSHYDELTAITVQTMEKEVLLHGTKLPEMVCKAQKNFALAEDIEDMTVGKKAPEATKIVSAEAAKKLAEDHLAIYTAWTLKAARTPNLAYECYGGEGRDGLASEVLHDLMMEYESRKADIAKSGMKLEAIRALALTRDREYLADVRASLSSKASAVTMNTNVSIATSKGLSIEDAAKKYRYSFSNLWQFDPSELGFTAEQIARLDAVSIG